MKFRNPSPKSQTNSKFQIPGSWNSLARGLAMFLGAFGLLNIVGGFKVAGFDANLWWIDLRWLPSAVGIPFLLVSAFCLIDFGVRPPSTLCRKALIGPCASLLGIVALLNTVQFYVLLARRNIHAGIPIPLSLMVAAALFPMIAKRSGASHLVSISVSAMTAGRRTPTLWQGRSTPCRRQCQSRQRQSRALPSHVSAQ